MINSNNYYLRKLLLLCCYLCLAHICRAQSLGETLITNKCYEITNDTVTVEKCYEETYDIPIIVNNNVVVINNSDSLHLINNLRFRYYEKLRKVLDDSLELKNEYILLQYENLLKGNVRQYNTLLENCDSSSNLFNRFMVETDSALKITSKSLELSEQSLENTMLSLKEAKELLEQERGIQFWDKLTIGIGGVGLGILIGILAQ